MTRQLELEPEQRSPGRLIERGVGAATATRISAGTAAEQHLALIPGCHLGDYH